MQVHWLEFSFSINICNPFQFSTWLSDEKFVAKKLSEKKISSYKIGLLKKKKKWIHLIKNNVTESKFLLAIGEVTSGKDF